MYKIKFRMLFVLFIAVLAGCAGPLKMVPTSHTAPSHEMVTEKQGQDIEDQFLKNEPRYTISLPQKMVLYRGLYQPEKARIYLWLLENNIYELIAVDLANSKIMWGNKLPKRTKVYGMGSTAADDIYLDLNYQGSALLFLDSDQGTEKWRHGKDAKEGQTGYCKYFSRKYNFFVKADSIIVQDPRTYETVSTINRFTVDPDRNFGKGYTRFYNIHVYEINDRFIIMDNGMHAVSKETGQTLWSCRLPTVASRYHTGKNVAMAVVGALVGAYGTGRGPDHVFPSPMVTYSNDSYFVSALSNLYRIDSSTGTIKWACDVGIGFGNRIDTTEDHIYLATCGGYASGIFCFNQKDGTQVSSFQTPFTRSLEVEALTGEKLEKLTENEMWERNLECYDALIGKKNIVPGEQSVYYQVIPTRDEIVVLSNDVINAFDKQDGQSKRSLPNPSFNCKKFERLIPVDETRFLAISKNEIAAINIEDFTLAWKFDTGWTIDTIDKFNVDSISNEHWYVHAFIDKKIRGFIVKKETGEMIKSFEADESLRGSNFLAVLIDNKVMIYH